MKLAIITDIQGNEPGIHQAFYDKEAFLEKFELLQVPQREIMFKLFYIGE